MSRPACRGNSRRSRTRSSCASAKWRPSTSRSINEAARAITAQASYNVTPTTVGAYFDKINCFCFTEQTLKPGETREMTVVFYVDPKIVKDRDQDPLNTITLSYTFYRLPGCRSGRSRKRRTRNRASFNRG